MFGIGGNELVLILIFGFIIFGPDKLPAMAKTIGQAIAKFRRAQSEMSNVLKNEVFDPNSDEPFKNPLDAMARLEKGSATSRQESFSDNKARYDRQREAQRRNEERKAQLAEKKAQARARMEAQDAPTGGSAAESVAETRQQIGQVADISVEALYGILPDEGQGSLENSGESQSKAPGTEPVVSIDELYGVVPIGEGPVGGDGISDAARVAEQTGKGE